MLTREETIDTRNPDQLKQEDPFNVPIPGQSLTSSSDTERVKQPPEESNPEKVLAFAMKRLKSPDVKEKMLDLLLSGLPVFMIDMARKEDIPVKVFMDEGVSPEQQAEEDQKLARVMEEQRPELASGIRAVKFQDQLKDRSAKASSAMAAREKINEKEMPVESDGSFLELGE
jgi:hypothetical protein